MKISEINDYFMAKEMVLFGKVASVLRKPNGGVQIDFILRDYRGGYFENVSLFVKENETDASLLCELLEDTYWFQNDIDTNEEGERIFSFEELKENILGLEACVKLHIIAGMPHIVGLSSCLSNLCGHGFVVDSPCGPVRFCDELEQPQSFRIFDSEFVFRLMDE